MTEELSNVLDVYIAVSYSQEDPHMLMTLWFRGRHQQLTRQNLVDALASRIPGMLGEISAGDKQTTVKVPIPAESQHQLAIKACIVGLEYLDHIAGQNMTAWRKLDEINISLPAMLTVRQIAGVLPDIAVAEKPCNTNDAVLKKYLEVAEKEIAKIVGNLKIKYLPREDVLAKF